MCAGLGKEASTVDLPLPAANRVWKLASYTCRCWESKKKKKFEKSSSPVRPSRAFCSLRPPQTNLSSRAMQFNEEGRRLRRRAQQIEFCPARSAQLLLGLLPTTPSYSSPHLYPPKTLPSHLHQSPAASVASCSSREGRPVWEFGHGRDKKGRKYSLR